MGIKITITNRSIAFPAIGTGVGDLQIEETTAIMIKEVEAHIARGTHLRKIVLSDLEMS